MELTKVWELVKRTEFAQLGFLDERGLPGIRTVWCTWHKGLKAHYISTNTSSLHVQASLNNKEGCLYFYDSNSFEGVCLRGRLITHQDREHRELLWAEDSIQYYPKGVMDNDYTVLELEVEEGRYYGSGCSLNITKEDIDETNFGDTPKDFMDEIHSK